MNRPHIYTLMWIVLGLMLCTSAASCAKVDAEETLQVAESDLLHGNIDGAVNSCRLLADSTETSLSPTQLCRVAIMYAKISDRTENQDYMASAAECYDRALEMDESSDSLSQYIENLNVDDRSYVHVISEMAHAMNTPIDYLQNADDEDDGDEPGVTATDKKPQEPAKQPATAA